MGNPSVVILGGGLSGVAAAFALARAGWHDGAIIERGPRLGGLAGSFERDGRFYQLATAVVITLMLRLQLHWSTRLQTYYTLALDYFYWVGARAAQRDIRRSSPAARSTPASEHRP